MTRKTGTASRRDFLKLTLAGSALAAAGSVALPRHARAQSLGAFKIGMGGADALMAPVLVPQILGYFKEAGLDLELLQMGSGLRATQAVVAGQIDVSITGATDVVTTTLAGKTTQIVYAQDKALNYTNIIVRKSDVESGAIRSMTDLAGKQIGVTTVGSAMYIAADYMVSELGIRDKVELVHLGDLATMLASVKSGRVAATIATIGMVEAATGEGWGVALQSEKDAAQLSSILGSEVPGAVGVALADRAAAAPELFQAYVDASVKGADWIFAHSPEEITDLMKTQYLDSFSRESVLAAVRRYRDSIWSPTNFVSPEAYGRLLDIVGDGRLIKDDQRGQVPYETCVNMSFVKKARNL